MMTDEQKILRLAEGLGLQRPSVFVEKDEDQVYAELSEDLLSEDLQGYGTRPFCNVSAETRFYNTDTILGFLLLAVRTKAKDRREAIDAALEATK